MKRTGVGNSSPDALGCLRELESSLARSRRALLTGELTGIELGIAEQQELVSQFQASTAFSAAGDRSSVVHSELREVAERVRHSGRVQAALLVRAARRTRMIASLLAGPRATYAVPWRDWHDAAALPAGSFPCREHC